MGAMMPSPRTVSQLLLPLAQEPPAGARRRRSPCLLAAFLLLLLNGSTALGMRIIQVTFSGKGPEFSMPALKFAYNGKDTVHFNYTTEKFVAIDPLVKSYVKELNSDAKLIKNVNNFVNDMPFAMEIIHQNLQALTAKPTITITSRPLKNRKNSLVLSCQVCGFYPRDIHTTWLRNGMAIDQEVQMTKILPNQDGTFQVQLQVEIDPGKGDTYTCEIKHLSIPDKLHVVWDPRNTYPVYGYVIGIIAGIIGILIAVAGGIIRWKDICLHCEDRLLHVELDQLPKSASEA
ncbi:class II histocompatibility antigen, B-L beta chain-like isoform X2 [Hypanus sabinus]|uniref:class II histocompatibility antigen, B-L beta chain-like isoform X2 n=1 Tax=Hypanus sabinus TaxID=79690 RepID=UPI0028C454EB|nr:class II histocompatibility antigen, B-L beta chain-like isoform X2 [Hypanus sabinus]